MLPVAMIVGAGAFFLLHYAFPTREDPYMHTANVVQPMLVGLMLFLQLNVLSPRDLHFCRWHFRLLAVQAFFFALFSIAAVMAPPGDVRLLLECAILCFICPTAAAAGVVTLRIGGSLPDIMTYTVLSDALASLLIPVMVPLVHPAAGIGFLAAFWIVVRKVFAILVLPCLLAWTIRWLWPKLQQKLASISGSAFYVWGFSLAMAIFLASGALFYSGCSALIVGLIAAVSLVGCLFQFAVGRRLSGEGDIARITSGQALGQKNTGFIIWLGLTYMTPVTSVMGGLYAIWQNLVNSYELYRTAKAKRVPVHKGLLVLLVVALGAVSFPETVRAQDTDSPSMLYRGRVAPRHGNIFNGTPYWDSTGFQPGRVFYNGRLYTGALVQIDASAGMLLVRASADHTPVAPDSRQVSWFTKGGRLFINPAYQGMEGAPSGFLEMLYDAPSETLFRWVSKTRYSAAGDHNGDPIGYYDPDYNSKFVDYFYIRDAYYVYRKGVLSKIGRRKAMRMMLLYHAEGDYPETLEGWHAVEGTGSDLVPPSVNQSAPGGGEGLPQGFFAAVTDEVPQENTADARYRNKVYEIGRPAASQGGSARVYGKVCDDEGKPLSGVVIYDTQTSTYTRSGSDGSYRIRLPRGENWLVFSDSEKDEQKLNIILHGDGGLNVTLHDKSTMLQEAVISAESMRKHRTAEMGVESISAKTMAKVPTAFGEGDIIKVVLTLPGVKTAGEAAGGFNVRGGSTDQNLILYNGNTIYNPAHLFGISSSFNPDIVEGVELYKSSIPARFGGRISSVLDVTGKEGNREKLKGSMSLGLLTSRFHIDGPLVPGRRDSLGVRGPAGTTFCMGGRTTYSNWLLGMLPENSAYSGGSGDFSDLDFSITSRLNEHNSVRACAYWSGDKFAFSADTVFRYSNLNASLHFNHSDGPSSYEIAAGIDRYSNRLSDRVNDTEAYTLGTYINQAFLRADYINRTTDHTLGYGFELLGYLLEGGRLRPLGGESLVIADDITPEKAVQPSFYLADSWSPSRNVSLDAGARVSSYFGGGSSYIGPEFRLSGKYSVSPVLSLKAGVNTMRQYIHLISNTSTISPMDTWKLSDDNVLPTTGWQAASGAYWTVAGGKVDISLETYYKRMRNHLDYRSGAVLVMNHELADDLVRTRGKAYGVEFMARKSVGKLNGWISYCWSRTFLQDSQNEGLQAINGGKWYKASYDKPHDFKLVGNYAFTRRYSISANIDYSTGRPVTLPVGSFKYAGGSRLAYSSRNDYRIPDYFRVDLAVNIDPGHYLKALAHASVTIGCYNVTGRKNAYSVYYTTSGGTGVQGYMVSVFATQIPYINLNLLF